MDKSNELKNKISEDNSNDSASSNLAIAIKNSRKIEKNLLTLRSLQKEYDSHHEQSKNGTSKAFKSQKIETKLNHLDFEEYVPKTRIRESISRKKYHDSIKSVLRKRREKLTFISDELRDLVQSHNDIAALYILEGVTIALKEEGLWNEESEEVAVSSIFPMSQLQSNQTYKKINLELLNRGTFLEEDDLTDLDLTPGDKKEIEKGSTIKLPRMSYPAIHNFMRSQPENLRVMIARKLIDSRFFDDFEEYLPLYRSCFLYSRSVDSLTAFENCLSTSLGDYFGHYTYEEYNLDKLKLIRLLNHQIEYFFTQNRMVIKALKTSHNDLKTNPKDIWKRYFEVWDSLTIKQQNALKRIYMAETPETYRNVASKLQITVDSLQSRLKAAIQKFKDEFPELLKLDDKYISKKSLLSDLDLNGLWRKSSAKNKAPVFRIDPITNERTEISNQSKPRKLKLPISEIAYIKALAIEVTPFPLFPETEYFANTKPDFIWDHLTADADKDDIKEQHERESYYVDEDEDEESENEEQSNEVEKSSKSNSNDQEQKP